MDQQERVEIRRASTQAPVQACRRRAQSVSGRQLAECLSPGNRLASLDNGDHGLVGGSQAGVVLHADGGASGHHAGERDHTMPRGPHHQVGIAREVHPAVPRQPGLRRRRKRPSDPGHTVQRKPPHWNYSQLRRTGTTQPSRSPGVRSGEGHRTHQDGHDKPARATCPRL